MRISDWSSDVCSSDLRKGSTTDLRHPRVVRQPGLRHRERQSDRTPRQHRGAQNMVSAIKRTCGIAALGLLTLASTCAWAGPVAGTCADVVATTPDAAASGPGMHASDVDDPPAVAFSIRDRMLLAEIGSADV